MEGAALKALAVALLAWIGANTAYPTLGAPPPIEVVPHQVIEEMVCRARCDAAGGYAYGVIYLDEGLRSLRPVCTRSVLVHELVHHLQHVTGRWSRRGPASHRSAMEAEAHMIQGGYLVAHGWKGRCV
jgi:hypothetical protein